jgi:hypothetical protein
MTGGCVFCDHDRLREADLYFENDFCIYSQTRDPRDLPDVIPGCGGIVPKVHRASASVIPRFDDEPMAGHGVRSGIKDPANRRPDPWRPGTGRHMARS